MKITFQLKASLDRLCSLCKAVETLQNSMFCSDKQMFEIVLMLEELCANVINYSGARSIEVNLYKHWEELVITITDDGDPFDPTKLPEVDITQPLEKRSPGGLGIHLVHHYSDSFEYTRKDNKNIVTLKKVI
ncbi:ATP-binding protein [Desulfosediminicola flagellatus]|uniref:ATP-binding protein n=1 Tax=Desulfosediminicola flagellatus TaxID=2569541 RepID=UPI0010AB95F2|nr:ATP-binding protein [Desulfosediminicola flagellatus]